jgi:outer membrane murein-binding lipoprotein Lpp
MRNFRNVILVAAVAVGGLLLSSCSSDQTVSQSDVESEAESQLAAQVDGTNPSVSCPDDLKAEVDETMECDLTLEGDDTVYPVTIKVTSVEGDQANFSIEVGDPAGGTTDTTAG